MKDVKSYLNLVGSRIGKAFSTQDFDTETELEFWSLSAEHMSRSEPPSFQDIVQWMDILYRAPVHVVYKKVGDELVLFKRFINIENLIGKNNTSALSTVEKTVISDFEQQVQNLQQKRKWYPDLVEHGISSTSVGNCEHIPLFDENREVWGVYIVGPNTKCPDVIVPRVSIVGRLLYTWLRSIDKDEEGQKNKYQNKMEAIVSDLGSGALNTEGLSRFFLRFLLNGTNNTKGAIIEDFSSNPSILLLEKMDIEQVQKILPIITVNESNLETEHIAVDEVGSIIVIPFEVQSSISLILMLDENIEDQYRMELISDNISSQLNRLIAFRNENNVFTESLLNTYYDMLRVIEKSRDKTIYHTPRLLAFIERFSMIFGLDDAETDILRTSTKLHDIGYVGGLSVESNISVGSELSHPLTGYKLVDQLPIHDDIKKGILTHHEWVNGSGTPMGIGADDISWTGKIISIFEFVVEFIESNVDNTSKTEEEWIDQLSQNIIERADVQFDMVLVPTVIELVKMLGWEMCCKLGTDE